MSKLEGGSGTAHRTRRFWRIMLTLGYVGSLRVTFCTCVLRLGERLCRQPGERSTSTGGDEILLLGSILLIRHRKAYSVNKKYSILQHGTGSQVVQLIYIYLLYDIERRFQNFLKDAWLMAIGSPGRLLEIKNR